MKRDTRIVMHVVAQVTTGNNMIDIRSQLQRSKTVKQVNRSVTKFVTLHWNGPEVVEEVAQLHGDAKWHVEHNGWDGLAYHYAVGATGNIYQTRDNIARLNHSGVTQGNSESLSVLVVIGEGQVGTDKQFTSLGYLLSQIGISPRYVLGHRFWPRTTACPGPIVTRWLRSWQQAHHGANVITKTVAANVNVRDEADVLSHIVRKVTKAGEIVSGQWVLGNWVKGDGLWLKLSDNNYIHGSVLDTSTYKVRA